MQQPVTELDTRFSDQDAVATGWEETRIALGGAELFRVSTVRADGRPHVTPALPRSPHRGGPSTNPFPRVRAREHGERS